jgi:NDP-sugar pyrophosphorylase family protein
MAESGQTFEFTMSLEEIASEDAKNDRLAVMRKERLNKPKRRKKVIEMGESGQIVEFSMSPEEITTEDVDNARLIALRKSRFNKPKPPVASFEMAESGMVIEFPVDLPRSMQRTGRGKLAFIYG